MNISSMSDYDIIYAYHQARSMQAKKLRSEWTKFLFIRRNLHDLQRNDQEV